MGWGEEKPLLPKFIGGYISKMTCNEWPRQKSSRVACIQIPTSQQSVDMPPTDSSLRQRGKADTTPDGKQAVDAKKNVRLVGQGGKDDWVSGVQGSSLLWLTVGVLLIILPVAVHVIEGRDTTHEVSKTWPASQFTPESASRAHGHVEFLAGLGVHMTGKHRLVGRYRNRCGETFCVNTEHAYGGIAGSVEVEEKAVNYLVKALSEIREKANKNIRVEVGIQR
eukprot:1445388-Rhodomonas_salina.3